APAGPGRPGHAGRGEAEASIAARTGRIEMRRVVLAGVLALSAAVALTAAETVPELFGKVKDQVKAEKCNDALVTMEVIDTEAAKPANAQYQAPLEGPLAFYRGVCNANLGNA